MSVTDELRHAFDGTVGDYWVRDPVHETIQKVVDKIADRIEEEIAEKYMELPTDSNGRIWHIGDTFKRTDGSTADVTGIELRDDGWYIYASDIFGSYRPTEFIHFKPTPAERIRDFVNENEDGNALVKWENLLDIAEELEGEER